MALGPFRVCHSRSIFSAASAREVEVREKLSTSCCLKPRKGPRVDHVGPKLSETRSTSLSVIRSVKH